MSRRGRGRKQSSAQWGKRTTAPRGKRTRRQARQAAGARPRQPNRPTVLTRPRNQRTPDTRIDFRARNAFQFSTCGNKSGDALLSVLFDISKSYATADFISSYAIFSRIVNGDMTKGTSSNVVLAIWFMFTELWKKRSEHSTVIAAIKATISEMGYIRGDIFNMIHEILSDEDINIKNYMHSSIPFFVYFCI